MLLQHWLAKGKLHSINGHNLFVIDEGGENKGNDKPVLVILHGYPTSSFDYHKVLPELTKTYRVIIHDHLGFGFSDKPTNYSYSLIEQADQALALWKSIGLSDVTLLAHDYGTSVATEILARDNLNQIDLHIDQLILTNGSIHIELAKLRLIQRLLKNKLTGPWIAQLTTQKIFNRNIKNIFYDRSKISNAELESMWLQLEHNNGRKVIHSLTNYIDERYYFWNRWIGALKQTQIKTTIIWAEDDPIAVPGIAKQLSLEIPHNSLYWLKQCGHFPMLEQPEDWLNLVLGIEK